MGLETYYISPEDCATGNWVSIRDDVEDAYNNAASSGRVQHIAGAEMRLNSRHGLVDQ
jgi:hypothetical protein